MAKRSTTGRQGSSRTGDARAKGAGSRGKAAGARKRTSRKSASKTTVAGRGGAKRASSKRGAARGKEVKGLARQPARPRQASGSKRSKLRTALVVGGTVAGAVAVARAVSRRSGNDAIALLERDHRRMEDLLKRAEDTTTSTVEQRRELLDLITRELRVHEMIEEQIFYPALRQHPEAKDLVLEGFEEHHAADVAIGELRELPPGAEQWGPKLNVLQEMIQHHIDEEEGEMFKTARSVLGRGELAALGRQMAALKGQAEGEPAAAE